MVISRRKLTRAIALASIGSCAAICGPSAIAQTYPDRPVVLEVGFSAGGATDVAARLLANELGRIWGQQVVVENRTGAGGNLATAHVAKSPPDGYTLLFASPSHAIGVSLYKKLPFDPLKDFTPIARVAEVTSVMVVNSQLPLNTVKQVVDHATKNPGRLNVASGGNGAASHLGYEMFRQRTNTRYTHVPYAGTAQSIKDLLSGTVDMTIDSLPLLLPHIQKGSLRALGVGGTTRSALLPNVPTLAEAGVSGYEMTTWFGVLGPAGLPPDIVRKINRDVAAAMQSPAVQDSLSKMGATAVKPNTPEEFRGYLQTEIEKFASVIKTAGIVLE